MISVSNFYATIAADEPLTMISVYDITMAEFVDCSLVDMILVGDSIAVTTLGYDGTDRVSTDEMVHHTTAVT